MSSVSSVLGELTMLYKSLNVFFLFLPAVSASFSSLSALLSFFALSIAFFTI